MSWEAWFTIGVVGLVFVGLARNWGPPDALVLGAVVATCIVRIITPGQAFHGFANENMLTVAALFVVAAGLRETGALDVLGGRALGAAKNELSALVRMALQVSGISAFLNNTPVVAMFVPVVSDWCRKNRVSPSRLLIPVSFFAILGGVCTLIGTSTNLVVNGLMTQYGDNHGDPIVKEALQSMSLFELGRVGLPMAIVGAAYMLLVGRRLLPDRKDLLERLGETSREYLVDMVVKPECRLIGKSVEQAGLRHLPGLFLIEIDRDGQLISPVRPDEVLVAGDRLTFTGVVTTIVDLERIPGLVPVADGGYESRAAAQRGRTLCEAVVSNTSPLTGKSIRDADFRALYNAAVIAVHRGGTRLKGRVGDIVLRMGDTLLLQTGPHFARAHRNNPDFYLVTGVEDWRPVRHDRALISIALLGLMILLLATSKLTGVPEVMSAFVVAGLMVATRCLSVTDARQSLDWSTLIVIGASFGLGTALESSGAAEGIARLVVWVTRAGGVVAAVAAVYLVTMLLSELISNNAAAALLVPLALSIAATLDANPRPFAMAVALAASACFASPIGYQTHLMVWAPGGYKFKDFVRVGLPLDILLWIVASLLIPVAWPLELPS